MKEHQQAKKKKNNNNDYGNLGLVPVFVEEEYEDCGKANEKSNYDIAELKTQSENKKYDAAELTTQEEVKGNYDIAELRAERETEMEINAEHANVEESYKYGNTEKKERDNYANLPLPKVPQ